MIKLYALKINDGIAQDPITRKPLIAPHNEEYKQKLMMLKKAIASEHPEYEKCKIITLKESFFK